MDFLYKKSENIKMKLKIRIPGRKGNLASLILEIRQSNAENEIVITPVTFGFKAARPPFPTSNALWYLVWHCIKYGI